MKYSKQEIGKALREELQRGYDIVKISNWAYYLYILSPDEVSPEIDNILNSIFLMDAGPEFEYTEQELRLLAELLINEAEDPIGQLNALKSKSEI